MTASSRTVTIAVGVLAVVLLALVLSGEPAWACDPDPSDWEAGIAACEEWQRELDRAGRGGWLFSIAGALLAILVAVLRVVRAWSPLRPSSRR